MLRLLLCLSFACFFLLSAPHSLAQLPGAASNKAGYHTEYCERRPYQVATGLHVVCSASFRFDATCDINKDLWNSWTVDGQKNTVTGETKSKDAFAHPWSHDPITVIGYELVKITGGPTVWFMVGGAIQPDPQIWMGPGENHAKQMWPAGTGQPWPSAKQANPDDMVDLHGTCEGNGHVTVILTVYYIPI